MVEIKPRANGLATATATNERFCWDFESRGRTLIRKGFKEGWPCLNWGFHRLFDRAAFAFWEAFENGTSVDRP